MGGPLMGIVQFFISVIAMVLFPVMPLGRMFSDYVAGKSRKYLASQIFTASTEPNWLHLALDIVLHLNPSDHPCVRGFSTPCQISGLF